MLCYFGAFGVADGVDAYFYFIDEVEEGLEHGPCQVLISDFLAHLNYNYRSLFLFFLLGSGFFLHADDFLLFLELFGCQEFIPLFVELCLFGLDVQLDGFSPQFFGLLVQQQHSRNVLFSPHPLPFDELHVAFVVVVLLVFEQQVLNRDDVVDVHLGVVVDVQTTMPTAVPD